MLPEEKHGFYVGFELRAVEDREASLKAGHPVFHDIEVATITMPGGNLVVDKVVNDDLLREWRSGVPGRKPASPFAIAAYEAFKEGREAPVNGIDLKNWPGVTPAQLKMCQGVNIRTVEDLATCNADSIRKLGMGGVALKDKAVSYMQSADTNKNSEEVSALKVEMDALKDALDKKDAQIEKLMDQLTEPEAPKRKKKAA
jgi:hypothetical protein